MVADHILAVAALVVRAAAVTQTAEQERPIQAVAALVVELVPAELAAPALLSFVILERNVAPAELSHPLAVTRFTHSHLLGRTWHELHRQQPIPSRVCH